jgi:hypothetical protein
VFPQFPKRSIKHRRNPIGYCVPPGADCEHRRGEKERLSKVIEEAVKARLKCVHEAVKDALSVLDQHCLEVMVTFGQRDSFPGPTTTTMEQALASQAMLHALARMLELRLLRCDVNYNPTTCTGQYAYHWTYLGRLVARHLGIVQ